MDLQRPQPPFALTDEDVFSRERFVPSPELEAWIRATFIDEDGALCNPAHEHLRLARIGCLWTNVPNVRQMNAVGATAEMPSTQGGCWQKAKYAQQLEEWFRLEPNFLLTFYAPYCATLDDATFCALCEHELYHCAQQLDAFGAPKFTQSGYPVFAMRGHDVEEFVGVVARYGVGSAAGQTRALVEAANSEPLIAACRISNACGTCGR